MVQFEVRLEKLQMMRTACVHAFSDAPEEDAGKKILAWAEARGLLRKPAGVRLFGRNTYPTDKPEPHGYEYHLTVGPEVQADGEVRIRRIPGGLYATVRFTDLANIREAWQALFAWVKDSGNVHVGWSREEHGWVDGFEEQTNFLDGKPPAEWVFDLWAKLKE